MFEVLFQHGPFTFRTFNLFLALAFLFTTIFLLRYILRKKMSATFLSNHFLFLLLLGFLLGRVFYIIENWSFFENSWIKMLMIWDLKISSFGFFYGTLLGLFLFTRMAKEHFWVWLDALVLSGMVGLIGLHVGHFFNGSDFGIPSTLPWAISFDSPSIPFANPLHPTQLYSALITFLIFGYAMKYNRRVHLSGMVGNRVIVLYSLSAFSLDFLHGAPSAYAKISFLIIAATAFIFFVHCSHQTHSSHEPS